MRRGENFCKNPLTAAADGGKAISPWRAAKESAVGTASESALNRALE
jgi:hypothetical protein